MLKKLYFRALSKWQRYQENLQYKRIKRVPWEESLKGGFLDLGNYVLLADEKVFFNKKQLKEAGAQNNADVLYFDTDEIKEGMRQNPYLKPDFSPELLLTHNYIGPFLLKKNIWDNLPEEIKNSSLKAYETLLYFLNNHESIAIKRIPQILASIDLKSKNRKYYKNINKAITMHLHQKKLLGEVSFDKKRAIFSIVLKSKSDKKVAIIIPFKDQVPYLRRCLASIQEKTSYQNIEILLVNNDSKEQATQSYLERIIQKKEGFSFSVKVINYKEKFNFSEINNFAAQNTDAEFLLFLNNDTKILTSGWILQLVAWAQQKEIGAVGAKLLYDDKTIQHAGIVLGVGGIANHAYYKLPEKTDFYHNHLHCIKNYSAVTGACLLIQKNKFENIGGFDYLLPSSYNDVDLCLKLMKKKLRNVYLPTVELFHFESKSRDSKVSKEEEKIMWDRWSDYIKNDRYYHDHLTKEYHPFKNPIFSTSKDFLS